MGRGEYISIMGIKRKEIKMKQMICNISKAAAMTITAIAFLLCACSREDVNHSSDGLTTTISLNIPMLSSSSRATIEGSEKENAIHNLRVIILKQGAESINKIFEKVSPGSILEIENVPVGTVQMYVIANEASLGKDYSNLSTLQQDVIDVGNSRKVLIKDLERVYFPKRGSEFPATGLPMSWMDKTLTIYPPSETLQEIKVDLERCVAKLNIIMQSTLSEDIIIKNMSFGAFFGDQLYLFREPELNLDVPNGAEYEARTYGDDSNPLNISIPSNGEETLVCYIYPSFAWKDPNKTSPYTIGFVSDKTTYEPRTFVNDFRALNSIARNKQVNITAKLSKPANINITFEVVSWESQPVEVPPFN